MKYTDNMLSELLDGYWDLCEGVMPDKGMASVHPSPFETASILKADLDMAIDMLSPGRWYAICDGLTIQDLQDNSRMVRSLSQRQQGIVRYHWLNQKGEYEIAFKARRIMLRFLNKGVRV